MANIQRRLPENVPGDFFVVVIGGRGAIVYASQALGCARGVKHGRD